MLLNALGYCNVLFGHDLLVIKHTKNVSMFMPLCLLSSVAKSSRTMLDTHRPDHHSTDRSTVRTDPAEEI